MEKEEEMQTPIWLNRGHVDEVNFSRVFMQKMNLMCVDGVFYSLNGRVRDERKLRDEVYRTLSPYTSHNLPRKVDSIMAVMRMEASQERLRDSVTRIHVANGIYDLEKGFIPRMDFCRYRLPVAYRVDAPRPQLWLEFVNELLEPDDVLTLQEYMGYCLIPVTMAQKMLVIIGRGGEGKSRIGRILRTIFGDNMSNGSLNKVEMNRFARADLEHRLLMVDDDLDMDALRKTNYIKSIITADTPMDLERKGEQSYQGTLHVRFMAFGNCGLQALHDRSNGFYRRQIVLTTKVRPRDRVDDPYLSTKLDKEAEGIFRWMLDGLQRLILNDFQFTISQRTQENMNHSISQGNNIVTFMESEGYFCMDPRACTTFRSLYQSYLDWCADNAVTPLGTRSFANYMTEHAVDYGIIQDRSIPIGHGRYARGFRGIRALPRF